jgi:hypothetical protein
MNFKVVKNDEAGRFEIVNLSGIRYQVSGIKYQVLGISCLLLRAYCWI